MVWGDTRDGSKSPYEDPISRPREHTVWIHTCYKWASKQQAILFRPNGLRTELRRFVWSQFPTSACHLYNGIAKISHSSPLPFPTHSLSLIRIIVLKYNTLYIYHMFNAYIFMQYISSIYSAFLVHTCHAQQWGAYQQQRPWMQCPKQEGVKESNLLHVLPMAVTGWLGPWGYTA